MPDDADDRHAERRREPREVERPPRGVELVHHRDDEAGRESEPQHLPDEEQRAREGAGVGRHDERVGRRHARDLPASTRVTTASSGLIGSRL